MTSVKVFFVHETDGQESEKEQVEDFKVTGNKLVIFMKDLQISEDKKMGFWFYEWTNPPTNKEMRLDSDDNSVSIDLKPNHSELLIRLKEPPKLFIKPPSFLGGGPPVLKIDFSRFAAKPKTEILNKEDQQQKQPHMNKEENKIDDSTINQKPIKSAIKVYEDVSVDQKERQQPKRKSSVMMSGNEVDQINETLGDAKKTCACATELDKAHMRIYQLEKEVSVIPSLEKKIEMLAQIMGDMAAKINLPISPKQAKHLNIAKSTANVSDPDPEYFTQSSSKDQPVESISRQSSSVQLSETQGNQMHRFQSTIVPKKMVDFTFDDNSHSSHLFPRSGSMTDSIPEEDLNPAYHLVYLHADVLVKAGKPSEGLKPMDYHTTLSTDWMYREMLRTLTQNNMPLRIAKMPLTKTSLYEATDLQPQILIINCHGGKDRDMKKFWLCFEDYDEPTKQKKFMVDDMIRWKNNKHNVKLCILAACHSEPFGRILHEQAKIPHVVCIKENVEVREDAMTKLMARLINSVSMRHSMQKAFDNAKASVIAQFPEENEICCCMHEHDSDCLWWQYKKVHGQDAACRLHKPVESCECKRERESGQINGANHNVHKSTCKHVQTFHRALTKMRSPGVENEFHQNHFPPLYNNFGPVQMYKLCCCKQHQEHTEVNKFLYLADEKDRDKPLNLDIQRNPWQKRNVPFEREKNESVIGNELGGTNFNIQLFIDRNLDIYKIIQFLLAREKNFLHITGPSGTGKTTIVRIAFHLATERDSHQKFKDGIKLIVCERATSIIQVEAKLRQKFNFDPHSNHTMEEIAEHLASQHLCVIFDNCDQLLLCEKQKILQEKLSFFSKRIKTIFISRKGTGKMSNSNLKQKYRNQELEIKILDQPSLVKLFRRLLRAKEKEHLLYSQKMELAPTLEKHPILELFEQDYEALPFVVNCLGPDKNLDQLYSELRSIANKIDEEPQSNDVRQFRFISNFWMRLDARFDQAKNITYLLCEVPDGLLLSQIRYFCVKYGHIFGDSETVLEFIDKYACSPNLDSNQFSSEDKEQTYLFHQKPASNGFEQVICIPSKRRNIFKLILETQLQKSTDYFKMILEMLCYEAQCLLLSIKSIQYENTLKTRCDLLSSHLDVLMWQTHYCKDVGNGFDNELDNQQFEVLTDQREAIDRFQIQEENFRFIIEEDFVGTFFTRSVNDDFNSPELIHLLTLIVVFPAILSKLNRSGEAKKYLNFYLQKFPKNWTLQKDLIELSFASFSIFDGDAKFIDLKWNLEDIRKSMKLHEHPALYAETLFLEGFELLIAKKQIARNPEIENRRLQLMHSATVDDHFGQKRLRKQSLMVPRNRNFAGLKQQPKKEHTAFALFQEAEKVFEDMYIRGFGREEKKTAEDPWNFQEREAACGSAKLKLVAAEYILQHEQEYEQWDDHEIKLPMTFKDCIKLLTDAEKIFRTLKLHVNLGLCLALLAKAYLKIGRFDQIVLAKRTIEDAQQINQEIDDYDAIYTETLNIHNQILEVLPRMSHNLIIFAKSFPIVEARQEGVKTLGPLTMPNYDYYFREQMLSQLTGLKLNVNLKFDILNTQLLQYVGEFGCRVLHLTSEIFAQDSLCIEGDFGMLQTLNEKTFKQFFAEKRFPEKLGVDLLVLAMPQSCEIAKYFLKKGVRRVIAFDLPEDYLGNQPDDMLDREHMNNLRYKYIEHFCSKLYDQILKQVSLKEAFTEVLGTLTSEKMKVDPDFMNFEDILDRDLQITPKLLPESRDHDCKIFDFHDPNNTYKLLKGLPHDTSKKRGITNINIRKYKFGLTGRKWELFEAQRQIGSADSACQLLMIHGAEGAGKTRFSEAVSYFFFRRYAFQYGIIYCDIKAELGDLKKTESKPVSRSQSRSRVGSHSRGGYSPMRGGKADPESYQEQYLRELLSRMTSRTKETLIVFDNLDCLPNSKMLTNFQMTLMKMLKKSPTIKVIVTSKKPLQFSHINKSIQYSLWLRPLTPIESVDLVLSGLASRGRVITKEELPEKLLLYENYQQKSVHELLWEDEKIQIAKGNPSYLSELTEHLLDYEYSEIKICRKKDKFSYCIFPHPAQNFTTNSEQLFSLSVQPARYENSTDEEVVNKPLSSFQVSSIQTKLGTPGITRRPSEIGDSIWRKHSTCEMEPIPSESAESPQLPGLQKTRSRTAEQKLDEEVDRSAKKPTEKRWRKNESPHLLNIQKEPGEFTPTKLFPQVNETDESDEEPDTTFKKKLSKADVKLKKVKTQGEQQYRAASKKDRIISLQNERKKKITNQSSLF